MALVRNFQTIASNPNEISLQWNQPSDFNNSIDEIIITKTTTHFPVELFNDVFPNRATDSRPIEIFRGKTIVGLNTGTISISSNTLTDTGASFPINPSLKGRLLRDSNSKVHRIVSNTSTTVTLEDPPANGKYIILAEFPKTSRGQENYEVDSRTIMSAGTISNLIVSERNILKIKEFEVDEVANLIFRDGAGIRFIIKSNTNTVITLFESASTPVIGPGMAILNSFFDSSPKAYIDNFRTLAEAAARLGTMLLDNTFYYYTAFTKPINTNVAQAIFANFDSSVSTQAYNLSVKNRNFGELLYSLWPTLYKELDTTEDLQDLMFVFGNMFSEIHGLIDTYNIQDPDTALITAVQPLSEQTGLPSVGFSIGVDTLRRIGRDLIGAWHLKGSKEGIAVFIKIITTWDITGGTGDYSGAIIDFLPNIEALRWFDPNLGVLNTRITETDPFVAGGRFAQTLPGIVIPGFFTFREFVIAIPNVALYIGRSENFTLGSNTTTMLDSAQNFGAVDSLVGNFLLPNTEEINDIYQIISNTATTITVRGIINNRVTGGDYAILSPLNTNRFIILNKLLPFYIPFNTRAGFTFTII